MEIKIIYNNDAKKGFKEGWGFSALIKHENQKTLFDVGWDPKILKHNLKKFNEQIEEIDKIFLSHKHWDHVGALPQLLRKDLEVIVPNSFSENMKKEIKKQAKLKNTKKLEEIAKNEFTTGELGKDPKEQSLIIKEKNNITIITGCSHPGLQKIIKKAKKIGKIDQIIGGFHGFNKYRILKPLKTIIPLHCTKNKAKIKSKFPKKTKTLKAGSKIKF